jgi:predicted Zn-dependent protease with MMP-like domain
VTNDQIDELLDRAEAKLDAGDSAFAIRACERVLAAHPGHPGAGFLLGDALRARGDVARAEAAYRGALRGAPDHAPSWCALGALYFDTLRFAEARDAAARALQHGPDLPDAWFLLGLLRERTADFTGADRALQRANFLDPHTFPRPVPLDDATVEAVVQDALLALHPSIRAWLANVPIVLEEVPDEATCRSFDPPMPPADIVGCFSGPTIPLHGASDPWAILPASIALFRRNLMRLAHDRGTLVDEVRVTVLHEIGHYLGLDEADLEARGLD